MLATIFFTSYAFGALFVMCELCQHASDRYDKFNVIIWRFKWYFFPDKVQQLLPMIIMSSQESSAIECFGSIACGRETFSRVNVNTHINAVSTYFSL